MQNNNLEFYKNGIINDIKDIYEMLGLELKEGVIASNELKGAVNN
jgi:hypothetical protein